MHLSCAPVRTASYPAPCTVVTRSKAPCRRPRSVVVGNFSRPDRIADVEHANTRIEVSTSERGRVAPVVHAAVMAPVSEGRQSDEVRYNFVAISRIVRFEHQL